MNEEVLVHHGVKGQRWGVITKEYVPKGTHSAKTDQKKKRFEDSAACSSTIG